MTWYLWGGEGRGSIRQRAKSRQFLYAIDVYLFQRSEVEEARLDNEGISEQNT